MSVVTLQKTMRDACATLLRRAATLSVERCSAATVTSRHFARVEAAPVRLRNTVLHTTRIRAERDMPDHGCRLHLPPRLASRSGSAWFDTSSVIRHQRAFGLHSSETIAFHPGGTSAHAYHTVTLASNRPHVGCAVR